MEQLLVVHSLSQCSEEKLLRVYAGSLAYREAADFLDYLRSDFFKTPGSMLLILADDQEYRSALRLEPWNDGLLLQGLETMPSRRGRGYARQLIRLVQARYPQRIYAHIHMHNRASEAVHRACGFRLASDTARLLDGTVTGLYSTYRWEPGNEK